MLNLLVIDDDQTFIAVLKRRLEHTQQFRVHTFTSVEQAVASSVTSIHGILLDMVLAEESGLDGIEPLKRQFSPEHLIILSGYASIATTVEAMRRGATDFIAKPVGLKELVSRLQDAAKQPTSLNIEPKPMTTAQVEWEHIQRVLVENKGNISATAAALGMHRRSLQRKLQKHSPSH